MSEKLYEMMDWPEIEAVVYSEESEPKKLLGPRVTPDGILIQYSDVGHSLLLFSIPAVFQPGLKAVQRV